MVGLFSVVRDLTSLAVYVLGLAVHFFLVWHIATQMPRWIGRRLKLGDIVSIITGVLIFLMSLEYIPMLAAESLLQGYRNAMPPLVELVEEIKEDFADAADGQLPDYTQDLNPVIMIEDNTATDVPVPSTPTPTTLPQPPPTPTSTFVPTVNDEWIQQTPLPPTPASP